MSYIYSSKRDLMISKLEYTWVILPLIDWKRERERERAREGRVQHFGLLIKKVYILKSENELGNAGRKIKRNGMERKNSESFEWEMW